MSLRGFGMKWLALLAMFWSSTAWADGIWLGFGPSWDQGKTNQKILKLAYEKTWKELSVISECGVWSDDIWVKLCDMNVGVRVETTNGVFARLGVGPSYLSHTDDRISTNFEFNLQGAIGIQQDHWGAGVKGDHYSNAGMKQPNDGRDFIGMFIAYFF
jgi:hypothetical protein